MSLWLTPEEIELRTGYRQRNRQCSELARQGVPFTRRRDGFPLVNRAIFESIPAKSSTKKQIKPLNYGALE